MMKRIAIFFDGTWNDVDGDAPLTNVAKLHKALRSADGNRFRQVGHYVEGIASSMGEIAQFLKGAVGYGVEERIQRAYGLLAADYEPGDEIHIFGFSRGAYQSRSLASFITLFGVPKHGAGFDPAKAWALYRTRESRRNDSDVAALRAAAHYPVRIKCVGVWDTVGNLGNPFVSGFVSRKFAFHDVRLTDQIEIGLHALSIDDVRGPFRPSLWTLPEGQMLAPNQHIEQVWFAGSHADVGGGFAETALSDIALRWMVERATATTGIAFDDALIARTTHPDPLGPQHSSATGSIFFWSGLFPFIRLIRQAKDAIPPLRRMLIGSWRSGTLPRGQVSINERIHESVEQRFGARIIELAAGQARTKTYQPGNLIPVIKKKTT